MRRLLFALCALTAAGALLAGCGGGSTDAGTRTEAAAGQRSERGPATTDAYRACGHFMQATIELKQRAAAQTITPTVRLGLIHYAQCMRTHGISMLDPDALGNLTLGNVAAVNNGFGRYTPQFHSADQSCRHLLPATISDDGTGP